MSEKEKAVVGRINACQRWFRIGSREPRFMEKVLLCVGDGTIVLGQYCDDNQWRYLGGDIEGEMMGRPMTHWMPLPTPPDKEEE